MTKLAPTAITRRETLQGHRATLAQEIGRAAAEIATLSAPNTALALALAAGDATARTKMDQRGHDLQVQRGHLESFKAALAEVDREMAEIDAISTQAAAAEARKLGLEEVTALAGRRIAVAQRIDAAAVEIQRAFSEFEDIGDELLSHPYNPMNISGAGATSVIEAVRGLNRVRSAFPVCVTRLWPGLPVSDLGVSLANSEGRLWPTLCRLAA